MNLTDIRVGFGYDVHELREGESFILGGVELTYHKGPHGHSDADILIHAICDAILGAANMRDIGYHFPDTDAAFKGADSRELLKEVMRLIRSEGWELVNTDATVCLELPKVGPHVEAIQNSLGEIMTVDSNRVSIKATTSEKMGFVGKEDGLTAYAVALIAKS